MASPINAGAIAMIVGLIVVPLVSSFTKVENPERANEIVEDCKKQLKEENV